MSMDIDVLKITRDLVNELEGESLMQRMKAEGVRLLYSRIQDEAKKQTGDKPAGTAEETK